MNELVSTSEKNKIFDLERIVPGFSYKNIRNICAFIELIGPMKLNVNKVRIGRCADGGYVLAPMNNDFEYVLNLGVGLEISADLDLIQRGYKVIAIDGTVENPLRNDLSGNYFFIQQNLGYEPNENNVSLSQIYKLSNLLETPGLALIDIEGSEYLLLRNEWPLLSEIPQIVIEFHGLELLFDSDFAETLLEILREIGRTHAPIHVHGNNSGHLLNLSGGLFPTILEITYLSRKSQLLTNQRDFGPFPSEFDFPNLPEKADVDLSPFFQEKPTYLEIARRLSISS